jgi:hypothetical protein
VNLFDQLAERWELAVAAIGGFAAFRRKRIVGIVNEEFRPAELHRVLADVQTGIENLSGRFDALDEKVDGIKSDVDRLGGRIDGWADGLQVNPDTARIQIRK